jgi:hypothetical protein
MIHCAFILALDSQISMRQIIAAKKIGDIVGLGGDEHA